MCNPNPTSPSSFLTPSKSHPKLLHPSPHHHPPQHDLHRWPTLNEVIKHNPLQTTKMTHVVCVFVFM